MKNDFILSTLVDFVDDAKEAIYSPQNIKEMMFALRDMGVKRIYWIHYGSPQITVNGTTAAVI